MRRTVTGMLLAAAIVCPARGAPPEGYQQRVSVAGPTRLDWTFVLASRSLKDPPAEWLPAGYDPAKQSYELFVPARPARTSTSPLPAVVFISPGNEPAAWKSYEKLCRARGVVFVGVRGAGNDVKGPLRVRIILDALDDVRRNVPLDPDRTYLAGFSGGARIACATAFALPDLFGGVMAVGGSGDLREEPWLRHRVRDRLSVALLTGPGDFNHGELTRLRGPYLAEVGVRTKSWVQPGLGHAIPNEKTLTEAYAWLEEGVKSRRELAAKYPATRLSGSSDREAQAKALLEEGKGKIAPPTASPKALYAGLMLLKGVLDRWPDTTAAAEARKLLLAHEDGPAWQEEDVAEQRRYLIARARALDAYGSGPLPKQYEGMRKQLLTQAIELWEVVRKDGPDTPAGQEAGKRLGALREAVGKE